MLNLPFLIFSTALPGRKIARRLSPNSPYARAFAPSIRPTSASTTLKPQSARDWLLHTAPDWLHALIFFFRPSSPIRKARTIACHMILPQLFPFRWRSQWLARYSILAPITWTALFFTALLLTPTGPLTILKPG